ncbi:MAG: diguanylate cyclase [Pseudomonadales bacterium]|jgi:diguanylate cyclase (GGDEF)-like protein|nr:diguanylate cyclase [Pseudomonadales bacterium]
MLARALTLLLVLALPAAAQSAPRVIDGHVDLSADAEALGAGVRLDGRWRFAPHALLPPEAPDAAFPRHARVPGLWNGDLARPDLPAGHGTATYRARVRLPTGARDLALRVTTFGTAWRLWAGTQLVASAGRVPEAGGDAEPDYDPVVAALPPAPSGELVLTLQIANDDYARGGPWELLWLGDRRTLEAQRAERTRLAGFLAGAFGVAGLYHLMLWATRRSDRGALAFVVICVAVALRALTVDDVQLLQIFPELSWANAVRIEYLTMPALLAAVWIQMRTLYPLDVPARLAWSVAAACLAWFPIVLLTPTSLFSATLPGLQALVVFSALVGPAFVARAALRGREGAWLFAAGLLALALAGLHDVALYLFRDRPSLELLGGRLDLQPLGLLVFIGCQASALALRSSTTLAALEKTSGSLAETRDALDAYARQLESRVAERTAELQHLNQELERRARIDGLTGIGNRRYFDEQLEAAWADHLRRNLQLALIMVDVDHFKAFNDSRGHLEGDDALRRIAGVLAASAVRPRDVVARYGGEELAVILPETDSAGATHLAQTMRRAVEALAIPHPDSATGVVTISAGVAAITPSITHGPEILVQLADAALYDAKHGGRNRVETDREAASLH